MMLKNANKKAAKFLAGALPLPKVSPRLNHTFHSWPLMGDVDEDRWWNNFLQGQESDRRYQAKIRSGEIKDAYTLESCIQTAKQELLPRNHSQTVIDRAIIRLMIWRHGPRDVDKINLIITGLKLAKQESEKAEDTQFYQLQIEAYQTLRYHVSRKDDGKRKV